MRARLRPLALAGAALLAPTMAPAQPRDPPPAPAPVDPDRTFIVAENTYQYGDYPRVVRLLTPLVEPDILLVAAKDLADAYEMLGLSHFFLGQKAEAKTYFERLIQFRPDHELNPIVVPPEAVVFYEELREQLADEIKRRREELRRQQEAEDARRRRDSLVVYERRLNSRFVASMPFGIGQFQNDQAGLGAVFLGTELLASGLSVGFYLAVQDLRDADGSFPRSDVTRAKSLYQAQLISGGIAVALIIAGIVQAHYAFDEDAGLHEVRPGPSVVPEGLIWRF